MVNATNGRGGYVSKRLTRSSPYGIHVGRIFFVISFIISVVDLIPGTWSGGYIVRALPFFVMKVSYSSLETVSGVN